MPAEGVDAYARTCHRQGAHSGVGGGFPRMHKTAEKRWFGTETQNADRRDRVWPNGLCSSPIGAIFWR